MRAPSRRAGSPRTLRWSDSMTLAIALAALAVSIAGYQTQTDAYEHELARERREAIEFAAEQDRMAVDYPSRVTFWQEGGGAVTIQNGSPVPIRYVEFGIVKGRLSAPPNFVMLELIPPCSKAHILATDPGLVAVFQGAADYGMRRRGAGLQEGTFTLQLGFTEATRRWYMTIPGVPVTRSKAVSGSYVVHPVRITILPVPGCSLTR
jgi:hypothetical protein